jgi:membrane protein
VRTLRAALERCGRELSDRAQSERRRHASVDAVFEMVDRDSELGGAIIAGALAYRLFIWLLPLAPLVVVAGLGIAADAASESPQSAAATLGLQGLVNSSIASASRGSARAYALLIGVPVLLYVTRGLLRALIVAHRLLWVDVRIASPRPTVAGTLVLLAALVGLLAVGALVSAAQDRSAGFGAATIVAAAGPYSGIWLVVSRRLLHRDADWRALIPGAVSSGSASSSSTSSRPTCCSRMRSASRAPTARSVWQPPSCSPCFS